MLPEKKQWTYREKMAQANREAKATVVALVIVCGGVDSGRLRPFRVRCGSIRNAYLGVRRNAWHMDRRHRGGRGAGPPGVRRFRFG